MVLFKKSVIWTLLYHIILFILLHQGQQYCRALINLDIKSENNNPIIGAPEKYDDWCKKYCSSNKQCNELFREDYIDLRIRLMMINDENKNEFNDDNLLSFHGNTVARQTLETQLILDISNAIEVSPCQIYILYIDESQAILQNKQQGMANNTYGENNYHSDTSKEYYYNTMTVSFRLYPSDIEKIQNITNQVQNFHNSEFYNGKVTKSTDAIYGVQIEKWDFSLQLQYSISMFEIETSHSPSSVLDNSRSGETNIKNISEEQILSYENENWCHHETNNNTVYCEFEYYFEDDISKSLNISQNQVNIFQIKSSGMDSIIVYFRFLPDEEIVGEIGNTTLWISQSVDTLKHQIQNQTSTLYKGNVTCNVDPVWGISGYYALPRNNSKHKLYSTPSSSRADTLIKNDYERCKQTHRCSRGWHLYNQTTGDTFSTTQLFPNGYHENIPLFLDFENWKEGTRGWSISHPSVHNTSRNNSILDACYRIRGNATYNLLPLPAYKWCPFLFPSSQLKLTDNYEAITNELILNDELFDDHKLHQSNKIVDIVNQIKWTEEYMDRAILDAEYWARIHVKHKAANIIEQLENQLRRENMKLQSILNPCNHTANCEITFNTSSLKLYGAMNTTGSIYKTPDGTELAVWSFDSIDISNRVNITVTGQRALALLSRSSIKIDTPILVSSGTLGGFPGGYSVSRKKGDRFHRICKEINASIETFEKFFDNGCEGDVPVNKLIDNYDIISNNVNGPGSGSTRVYSMTIETIAPTINKVQTITTYVPPGQTINGEFTVQFQNYSTGKISHDTTAGEMKRILENSLNAADTAFLGKINRTNVSPGIGIIDVTRLLSVKSINNGGYLWKITFTSAVGNIAPLEITNHLSGKGVTISTDVIHQGNEIGGNFSLKFLGSDTRPIAHNISDEQLKKILLDDIPAISSSYVVRTDPTGNCDDGLCSNGPSRSGGHTWTLIITTKQGNSKKIFDIYFDFMLNLLNS